MKPTAPAAPKPRAAAARKEAPPKAAAPLKPAATKRAPDVKPSGGTSVGKGFRNGGLVAMAATALAGMTFGFLKFRKQDAGSKTSAHQADGTDSSASFEAGIADEGTIPDTKG